MARRRPINWWDTGCGSIGNRWRRSTQGTCINPRFAESLGSFTITCLGLPLAVAAWDPQRPGTIHWTEGGFEAVLKRISGTEALPPGAEGGQ